MKRHQSEVLNVRILASWKKYNIVHEKLMHVSTYIGERIKFELDYLDVKIDIYGFKKKKKQTQTPQTHQFNPTSQKFLMQVKKGIQNYIYSSIYLFPLII